MTRAGKRLLKAAAEMRAIARGEEKPRPIIPNAETVAALEAVERGEMKSFTTIDDLVANLNSEADDD